MVESHKEFDPSKAYLLQNMNGGKFVEVYNDSWTGLAADGIRGSTYGGASAFKIIHKTWELEDNVVAIEHGGKFVNRWHGGDSNGTELGMYGSCDEHSLWLMNYV